MKNKIKPTDEEKQAKREFDISLGEYLKDARLRSNLSQKEVAEKCGLETAQFISNIERGECAIPPYIMRVMIKEYGVKQSDILEFLVDQKMDYYKKVLTTAPKLKSRR